jgi:hypothetical protein
VHADEILHQNIAGGAMFRTIKFLSYAVYMQGTVHGVIPGHVVWERARATL